MLDKKLKTKMVAVVAALTLLSATAVLGAGILVVNGSGIVATAQGAPPEVELLIGHSGSPNILVITAANVYWFNGVVNSVPDTGSNYVEFSGTDSVKNTQYSAKASKIDLNTWTLEITYLYPDGSVSVSNYNVNGHLQINSV